jgi:hypothetical protein
MLDITWPIELGRQLTRFTDAIGLLSGRLVDDLEAMLPIGKLAATTERCDKAQVGLS